MSQIKPVSTWYLYIIRCANSHLYTGVTTDVERRFTEHQSSGPKAAKFLKGKGPLTLVYQESQIDRSGALKREIAVKKMSRQQKLQLITQYCALNAHTENAR
ncbi:GIY-YIG nuclease family protein [Shewanella basaltis]|jgi:putative endonuclease|nr:GIY-YIG nuclease family protein [Shewanella basaltis]MCL1115055.1 GIY-YIG nuclease family protein [Shewanella basaltis]